MTKLTLARIRKDITVDHRIDPEVELDEAGKAIVWLRDGWTWSAADDNRTVEAFYIGRNADEQPTDTVSHWIDRVAAIEPVQEA